MTALNTAETERLEKLFQHAGASGEDREFWLSRIAAMPDSVRESILGLLEMFPRELAWFRGIQTRKEQARRAHDQTAWQTIVDEEATHLSTLNPLIPNS